MQYGFLQHQTLLSPSNTSTTNHHFCFSPAYSFSLELFLCSSPVAHWTPTDVEGSSSGVISFCLFILFRVLRAEYRSVLPFPSLVDHILSELSTVTHPISMALHGMAHSFVELHKAVIHVIILLSSL